MLPQNIERIQLSLYMPVRESDLFTWIYTSIKEQIQELDISLHLDGCYILPLPYVNR